MSSRTELPWSDIQKDVIAAIDACNEQRLFIPVKKVASHILKDQSAYPHITDSIRQMTRERVVMSRISMALNKLGWPIFSYNSTSSGTSVYVDPRYRE